MAYQVRNINPLDLKPATAVGVGIPFNAPGVFPLNYTTQEQLKDNLINFFLTNTGERPFNPDFGGNLRRTLFEQITEGSLDGIKLNLEEALARYFPTVSVNKVEVLGNPDQNNIFISVKYSIRNTGVTDELQLNFSV